MTNDKNALAARVAALSKLLTRDRGNLPPAYLRDAGLRHAYISYFLPSNIRKMHIPLHELLLHPSGLPAKKTLRVLDIGCGPGAGMLGVMSFFSQLDKPPELEITALDQVPDNLKEAETLFAAARAKTTERASLKTIRAVIKRAGNLPEERFDIIILANVLNELFFHDEKKIDRRTGLLKDICANVLDDSGSCIIIEPALRETSREMLMVRDRLIECGVHLYSPCLCQEACPALSNVKDWCHEDIPWEPPEHIREIDRITGLRKDSLKFSYLVLRKDTASLADVYGANLFRIVSEPLVSKGKKEFYICGAGGRRLVTRLDKDRTSLNQPFETIRRGSVVSFERLAGEGTRVKVEKDTTVARRSDKNIDNSGKTLYG